MKANSNIKNITGIITVQIEGFFTERFINLCRINNVKIWNVRNIVKGIIRFKMNIVEFKKLRKIARKTKCHVKIKEKKGLYFTLFKYRKRKIIFILLFLLIFFSIAFSMFIWNIEVSGNESIPKAEVIKELERSGIHVGKAKIGLDKKKVINNLRVQMQDLSWVGIEVDGTTAKVKIVEKTKLADKYVQNIMPGDIIANKAGIITKIVPENGTAKFREGSYIEVGSILIEGTIYSKVIEPVRVGAKGIVRIDSEYEFRKEYKYLEAKKDYTKKQRYTIGITINSKENMLNYLNKSKKYDITKSSKKINLFGINSSLDIYKCVEYVESEVTKTREELKVQAMLEADSYIKNEVLKNTINPVLLSTEENVEDVDGGVIVTIKYKINEQIGDFVERIP
ncbi:MAG: sporulation protein YqfD [Clostridia bacterium]